ncbi:Ger(x)C family spore germination protein [Paenibacillus jiagnxiensis]|uniref:Ger(x)C family spore germination protein n=1 Tax=Paenibacillus jiagnxiensis TaxID=3228926 RepID=UPI0033B0CACB
MSSHSKKIGYLVMSMLLLLMTGCWSSNEIEDLSVYVGLGFDSPQKNKQSNNQDHDFPKRDALTVTVQLVPQAGGKKENQSGGSSSDPGFLNEQMTGDSIIQIFRQFALRNDRPLIGHHLKVIVVSSKISKKYSLEQLLDFILRDNDIRPSCLVVVSHQKASDALNAVESGEIPAFYLRGLVDNRFRSNKILPAMYLAKLDALMESGSSFLLQNVVTNIKGEPRFSGAGVYQGKTKKWIGELEETDLEGLSWIMGGSRGGALKTYAPKGGHTITYEIKNVKSRIIPKVQGNEISFHVRIESEGRLMEDWSAPEIPSTTKYLHELEEQFEEAASKQIQQVLNKMQNIYHVDVGGFREQLRIKHPQLWEKVKKDWDKTFSQTHITYDVKMKITEFGSTTE